jgi:hypothetical protein
MIKYKDKLEGMVRNKESEAEIHVDEQCSDGVTRGYLKFQYRCVTGQFYTTDIYCRIYTGYYTTE